MTVKLNKIEDAAKGNFLDNVINDMPNISPMADRIAQEALDGKQENNPVKSESPPAQKLNKDGTPAKQRGRKPGQKSSGNQNAKNQSRIGGIQTLAQSDNIAENAQRIAAAQFIVNCVEISGVTLAGEAGKMESTLERPGMVAVWDKYLEHKNMSDLPPGVMVVIMMGQYYAKVLSSDEARPKTEKIKSWFSNKVFSIFKRVKNARFGSRDNGKRKNDTGEASGERVSEERD